VGKTVNKSERTKFGRKSTNSNLRDLIPNDVVNGYKEDVPNYDVEPKPKERKPKKEKTSEEVARERISNRVDVLRGRAAVRGIEFSDGLAEQLRGQSTMCGLNKAWKRYLQSLE
jgi:hypothetical protein